MLLPSFYLENFRIFDQLEVKRLGRINLIVGRNNVGKSAFLEAVYIYATRADSVVLMELARARQEQWESGIKESEKEFSFSSFRHFFKGHKLPLLNETGFKLASKKSTPLHVNTAAYITEKNDKGLLIRRKLTDTEEIKNLGTKVEVFIVAEQDNYRQVVSYQGQNLDELFSLSQFVPDDSEFAVQLVPTQGISDNEAAEFWDAIDLTGLEEIVLDGVKLIEERLQGLTFVIGHKLGGNRIPLVKLKDQKERVSLKSLGDGVTRVFHIMLALVNAKDGVLLIDEFENGLHWTVQESVWRVLFTMAEKLNVQVFCTTHSRDCINAFDVVWHEFENEAAFFRLYAHNNEIRVREYDLETLSDSLETDVDVR